MSQRTKSAGWKSGGCLGASFACIYNAGATETTLRTIQYLLLAMLLLVASEFLDKRLR